jgi:hypothetical protein
MDMRSLDFEKALADPAAVFHGPEEIAARADLTHDEKRELLHRWRQDELELADGQTDGLGSNDQSLIRRVARALANLDVATGDPGTPKGV